MVQSSLPALPQPDMLAHHASAMDGVWPSKERPYAVDHLLSDMPNPASSPSGMLCLAA